MKFIIIGKNIDVTPGIKDAVESKLGKLQRYFTPDTEIHVTLSVQKEHQKIEVTIPVKGNNHSFRAGKRRYVCIHRPSRRSHRASAQKI